MSDCDEVLSTLLLGGALDRAAAAHVAGCARCRVEEAVVRRLSRALAADAPPAPSAALTARVLRAAAPLLEGHARRAARAAVVRAVAAALLPLPAILLLDVWAVRTMHALLSTVLPGALSVYVVFNYALLLAMLLALTYGAVPILAARQRQGPHEVSHA